MNKPSFRLSMALCVLILAAIVSAGCSQDEDSPTAPSFALRASFSGLFSPAELDEEGNVVRACQVTAIATTEGGEPFSGDARYRNEWIAAFADSIGVVASNDWPFGERIVLTLPPDFGRLGGLYTLELLAEDAKQSRDRATASLPLNCTSGEEVEFQGR